VLLLYPLERLRIEMQSQACTIMRRTDSGEGLGEGSMMLLPQDESNDDDEKDEHEHDETINADGIENNHDNITKKGTGNDSENESPSSSSKSSFSYEVVQSSPSKNPTLKTSSPLIATLYRLHIQKSLYRGSKPIALTIALSNFIFFYTLQSVKTILKQKSVSLLTSTIAGVVNVLLTNPLWVANLRIVQSGGEESEKGLFQCLKEIWKKEGVGQLWAGTGASLLLVSNPAIQYYVYENIKMELLKKRRGGMGIAMEAGLGPMEAFIAGAIGTWFVLQYIIYITSCDTRKSCLMVSFAF